MWLNVVMGKNWAHSVDQCWMQALQFSVHLINLLSIFPRCSGFTRIQKAVVDQTGSRVPNSDLDLFWVQIWLWEVLWSFFLVQPLSWLSPVVIIKYTFCCMSQSDWEMVLLLLHRIGEDDTSKWFFFLFSASLWGTQLSSFFTFPICFRWQTTVEWLTLSSLATSCAIVSGWA